jgi:hypothetical protein
MPNRRTNETTFDAGERATLAGLADALIPSGEGFPSASEAGVAGEGLDRVLAVRPDLATGLKRVLALAAGRSAAEFVVELQRIDPAGFGILAELVPGAYFLNDQVRAGLRYDGQRARPIDPNSGEVEAGLLQPVLNRGPIYRPTPGPDRRPPTR